ncbi:MAG: hypothetical protein H2057_07890 [Alphaproteobacteria bacterium]|nr:hypothetical protein [Alphaproteobacteria bacterium]
MTYKPIPLLLAVACFTMPAHANVFKDIKKALSATSTTEWLDRMYAVAQLEEATKEAGNLDQIVRNIDKEKLAKKNDIKRRLLGQINKMEDFIQNTQNAPNILKKTEELKKTLSIELDIAKKNKSEISKLSTLNNVTGYVGNLVVWATGKNGLVKNLVDAVNSEGSDELNNKLLQATQKINELEQKITELDQKTADANTLLTPEAREKVNSYTQTLKTLVAALANTEKKLAEEIKHELSLHSISADNIIASLDTNMKTANCSYIGINKSNLTPANFQKCRAEFFKNAKKKATMGACTKLTVSSSAADIKACRDDYRHSKDG